MEITFLGATGTVTGSKYLLTAGSRKVMVDCGLFQGFKQLRLRNWESLPVSPAEIDAVISAHEIPDVPVFLNSPMAIEAIPWGARIFSVIDTLDAMTSDRPYQKGLPFEEAKAEILRLSGVQFDPEAVKAFITEEPVLREMVALKCGGLEIDLGRFDKGK